LAEFSFVPRLTDAFVVQAVASIETVFSAFRDRAVESFPAFLTDALEVSAESMSRAVVRAGVGLAVFSEVSRLTDALASQRVAFAVPVAVLVAVGN